MRKGDGRWSQITRDLQRSYLLCGLESVGGNVSAFARSQGISRQHAHELVNRLLKSAKVQPVPEKPKAPERFYFGVKVSP